MGQRPNWKEIKITLENRHPIGARDILRPIEMRLLFAFMKRSKELVRSFLWVTEIDDEAIGVKNKFNYVARQFSERTGLLVEQLANFKASGWVWCGASSIEEYLYDILKHHPERVIRGLREIIHPIGWSEHDVLEKLEKLRKNELRESSEGESPSASDK
jgi:hypothetical protein